MRVAVVGAGIVGVTTALALAEQGHRVEVYERRASVAAEASFANAGLVAPGEAVRWSSPSAALPALLVQALRHVGHSPGLTPWLWRWWRAHQGPRLRHQREQLHQLARYSQQQLKRLSASLALEHERQQGHLVLLRTGQELDQAQADLALLSELGERFTLLDPAQARRIEPGLNPDTKLSAAIHMPLAEVANCRQAAQMIKAHAQALGVRFHFQHEVVALAPGQPVQLHWRSVSEPGAGELHPGGDAPPPADVSEHDAVVLCSATPSLALLRPLGLRLPLRPVWGCTITAPLRSMEASPDMAPRASVLDDSRKVCLLRLGQRLRVSGGAQWVGSADTPHAPTLKLLYRTLDDWFPGVAQISRAQAWQGARPMLSDNLPALGASGLPGIWFNLGHGDHGWALSAGCARVLADVISQRTPDVDISHLTAQRWR